jgi:transposase
VLFCGFTPVITVGVKTMMGEQQVDVSALFYEFLFEKHVPASHMLRAIDRFVDLGAVRPHLAPVYSTTGRPSVDPELLIRMLIIGYCYGIRSERRLCEEVHLNLGYRWFCRLGLAGEVPDHSTFSKNRHGRFRASDLLRQVFETVLRRCIEEGLVGGDGFAVDGSLIKADASRQKGVAGAKGLAPEVSGRAVDEYLAVLDDAAFGAATEVVPKFISPADPAARWTGAPPMAGRPSSPMPPTTSSTSTMASSGTSRLEHRDMRLDSVLVDEPAQHLGRAVGTTSSHERTSPTIASAMFMSAQQARR